MTRHAWAAYRASLFDRYQLTQTGNSLRPLLFGGVQWVFWLRASIERSLPRGIWIAGLVDGPAVYLALTGP